jgi:hypothetical protein
MRIFIILLTFCIVNLSFAQKTAHPRFNISGEKGRGSNEEIILHQTIQASDGRVISVGATTSSTLGGSDGYIVIFNPMEQGVKAKRFGGRRDDVFNSITQLADGTFLIAGSTTQKGKEEAWLFQIDEAGDSIRADVFARAGLTAFQSVLATDDGGAFLIGTYPINNKKDIICLKIKDWVVQFETKLNLLGDIKNIKSAVLAADGGVVMVGDTQKNDDIWVAKIDKKGGVIPSFNKRYGETKYEEHAAQIIKTADNGFAIIGMTNNSKGKGINALLFKLNEDGIRQWESNYGGKDFDTANSVVETNDGHFYIVGETRSHNTDARHSDIYFVKTNTAGEQIWADHDGTKQDDKGNYITQLYDGSFLLTAKTGETNSWFYRFFASDDNLYNTGIPEKPFQRSNWKINSDNGYLEANTRTSLSVTIKNNSSSLLKNVQLKCKSPKQDIQPQSLTYLGAFRSGETKIVNIPIHTGIGLDDNQYTFGMELLVGDKSVESFPYDKVKTKKLPPQNVYIKTPPQYETSSEGETILKLTIENPKSTPVQDLLVQIEVPSGIKALSSTNIVIPKPIAANGTTVIEFRYKGEILTQSGASTPKFVCSLFEKVRLIDKKEIETTPLSNSAPTGNLLVWTSPDEGTNANLIFTTSKPTWSLELRAYTNKPITEDDFEIFIDEKLDDGSKMRVRDLSSPTRGNNIYTQIYKFSVEFKEEKTYTITVKLKTSKGITLSKPLNIKYDPGLSNLHVISIGTTISNLKYTAKDASDVADFFKKQPNSLFKKTNVIVKADSSLTTDFNMKTAFYDLAISNQNGSENKIEKKDFLIVFISSHGKIGSDGQYKLLPSNYNSKYEAMLSIDYQTDIIDKLKTIDCHKLVFIDACHSGATSGVKGEEEDEAAAKALIKLSQTTTGTTIITSCQSNENSYENEKWENGAFTEALLEAFSNQSFTDDEGSFHSDDNNDSIITIGEIMEYIQKRVPKMVASVKKQIQTPVLVKDELGLDTPLIRLKN